MKTQQNIIEFNTLSKNLLEDVDKKITEYYKGSKIPIEKRVTYLVVEEKVLHELAKLLELEAIPQTNLASSTEHYLFRTLRWPNGGSVYLKLLNKVLRLEDLNITNNNIVTLSKKEQNIAFKKIKTK